MKIQSQARFPKAYVYRATQGHTIVLSSGDLDFLPAINLITQQISGRLVLFTYDQGFHADLSQTASEHWLFVSVR